MKLDAELKQSFLNYMIAVGTNKKYAKDTFNQIIEFCKQTGVDPNKFIKGFFDFDKACNDNPTLDPEEVPFDFKGVFADDNT